MDTQRLNELQTNKTLPSRKQNKEQLVELLEYYESCLDKIQELQSETKSLYTQSNEHQENIKEFNDFYTEYFSTQDTDGNQNSETQFSKIEHFKNLYDDFVLKVSTLTEKTQDIDNVKKNY